MISDLIRGATSYFDGLRVIRQLRLWKYMIIPGLISLGLAILIIGGAWSVSDNVGQWLFGWYKWEAGRGIADKVGTAFGGVFVLALGYIVFKNLVIVLVGPFMSPLSERIESHITGRQVGTSSWNIRYNIKLMARGIGLAVRNIVKELAITIVLLIMGLIPIFTPFVTFAILAVQGYYAGFGNMDFTLERFYDIRNSKKFVSLHKGLAIGNGVIYILMISTVVGIVFAPALATAAATLETLKRIPDQSE